MDKLKKEFASKLLKVKAIKLQPNDPFTWASGWKSPFYCDNRKTLSFPELRNYVKLELVHAILEQFPEADAVAGVATGAIAQGALVADELNMPFVYVRSKPKDHGMQNLIEGQLDPKYNKWGRRKVEQALWMKHIPKDISDPIFEEIEDDLYMETLLPLMKNKYKTIKAKNDYERSMKLIRFALGRGYSMEVIHKCIDRMKEEDLGDIDFEEEF